jgi:hypothetical protein
VSTNYLNASKAAELRIATWFLEAGWEVFSPIVDARQTDFVVRVPDGDELLALQVKSTQASTLNAGQLDNQWRTGKAPFDYLIFIDGRRERGVIFAKTFFVRYGRTIYVFKNDSAGYSRGPVRPVFDKYSYDLSAVNEWERGRKFCERFLTIHRPATVVVSTEQNQNEV